MISKINFYSSIFLKLHLVLKKVEFTFKIKRNEKSHKTIVTQPTLSDSQFYETK